MSGRIGPRNPRSIRTRGRIRTIVNVVVGGGRLIEIVSVHNGCEPGVRAISSPTTPAPAARYVGLYDTRTVAQTHAK